MLALSSAPVAVEIGAMARPSTSATVDESTAAPDALVSTMRRTPQQERGAARIARLLDAADAVIAEVGVERATTNRIAAAASTSVGSLYQFFPNKDAMLHALSARYADAFEALKQTLFTVDQAHGPLTQVIARLVAGIGAWCDTHPAYLRLHEYAATTATPEAARDRALLHEPVVERVAAMLAARYPQLGVVPRETIARVQVQTMHAVVMYSAALEPISRGRVRDELARTLVEALRPFDAERSTAGSGD